MRCPLGTVSIRSRLEVGLEDWLQDERTQLIGSIGKESSAARTPALLGRAERSSLKAA